MNRWTVAWIDGGKLHSHTFEGSPLTLFTQPQHLMPPGSHLSGCSLPSEYNIISIVRVPEQVRQPEST